MKVEVLDLKGKKTGSSVELNELIWKAPYNADLVAQAVYVYQSNARTGNAHAKTRGDVRGGGRKPWRQKGTGRARHGSIRSPLWVGGGVTFVPNNRNWDRSLNKKMKKNALKSLLSKRLEVGDLAIYDLSNIERKDINAVKATLFVTDAPELYKKVRNMQKVKVVASGELNCMDILAARAVYFDHESVSKLESRLVEGEK